MQRKIEVLLRARTQDLHARGLDSRLVDWIIKTSKTINAIVAPIHRQPELENTVIVTQPKLSLQPGSDCIRLEISTEHNQTRSQQIQKLLAYTIHFWFETRFITSGNS